MILTAWVRNRSPMLLQEGRAGVEAEYELTEEFNYLWKMKAREILAKTEWRKRKLAKRVWSQSGYIILALLYPCSIFNSLYTVMLVNIRSTGLVKNLNEYPVTKQP